jgi:hypothetical protein
MAFESADGLKKSNQSKLDDLWWDTRGPGQSVPKFDDGGNVIGGTTLEIELGWLATNFARIMWKLDTQEAVIRELAVKQGVVIDYDEIAKSVVDEQAKRLSSPTINAPEEQK